MSLCDPASGCLRLRRTDSVPQDADARHVDQLAAPTYRAIFRSSDEEPVEVAAGSTPLESGDVVVYTEFLRVERA